MIISFRPGHRFIVQAGGSHGVAQPQWWLALASHSAPPRLSTLWPMPAAQLWLEQPSSLHHTLQREVCGVSELDYLGNKILVAGILPLPSHGCHPGVSPPLHYQGAAGIPGDGQLLQEIPTRHCQAVAAHGRDAKRQEGVGTA
jgi:hypothetical protein